MQLDRLANREKERASMMVNKEGQRRLTNHMTQDHITSHKIEATLTLGSASLLSSFILPQSF